MKDLVIYYSWTGNTEAIAKEIHQLTDGDIIKIEEARERKPKSFGSSAAAAFLGLKSKLKPIDFKPSDYENIFLGGQVWAGRTTPAFNSFLKNVDFKDKKVYLFLTKADDKVPQKVIDSISKRVEASGGKLCDSFSITTKMNSVVGSEVFKDSVSNWVKIIKSQSTKM